MPPRPLTRLRRICLSLPEAHEVKAWGEPTFRVRNKLFAMYASANTHHGAGRPAVWLKALKEDQQQMVRAASDCYFVPPYVGKGGWVGIWLDGDVDWNDVAEFAREAYCLIAPKKLVDTLTLSEDK
jgi:predicted DNA-binding protein (MmcQ/YjbR family)